MKIDLKKIINIKNKSNLKEFQLDKPIFQTNYLFHYLIQLGNLTGLKLQEIPIYIENNDGLNGFHLAAKEYQTEILEYLIETYPDYIYNRNKNREAFTNFLSLEEFSRLMKKYQNLDWYDLIINGTSKPYEVLKTILTNLNFKDLNDFTNLFKIKPEIHTQFLFSIINNYLINQEQKIKILEKYSDQEINAKNETGEGIIFVPIEKDEEKLFDYLLKRNIDLDYYTFIRTDNPLNYAIYNDILNNRFKYSKIILEKVKLLNPKFYREINKYADNIAHSVIYIRINRNKQILSAENAKSPNYFPDFEILKLIDNYSWNQNNIEKRTPLNLITNLEFDIYSKLFDEIKIQVSSRVFDIIEQDIKEYGPSPNITKWTKLFKSLPEYKEDDDSVNLKEEEYTHYTLFQAKFKDVGIFSIYLADTYKDLLIPNMNSYLLNNLTFEDTYPFSDDIIAKEPIFPWVISYYSSSEYYIHPYLNNIINGARRDGKKRFAAVFISITLDSMLHANVLVYDFKNMTVERFEPYGNTTFVDNSLDEVLEEELTWNTGLKYLKTGDFLPWAGFQTISDETNLINKKSGDFGGFCLAWCLWYLETKLKNPDVDSKNLVSKLIHKITKLDIKFSEYIRNYSNKINEKRIQYLEDIGMDPKIISNVNLTVDSNIKLTNYLINKFSSLEPANK
jgi:hypothetical protein